MIVVPYSPQDLNEVRFVYSPLVELSLSYMLYRGKRANLPKLHLPRSYRTWYEDTRLALAGQPLPYMDAVVLPCRYLADFVTPTPYASRQALDDQLADVLATSHEIVRRNVEVLIEEDGMTDERREFLDEPDRVLRRLVDELRCYWELGIAPHWDSMRAVLENDVFYRARQLAEDGVVQVMGRLAEGLLLESEALVLDKSHYDHVIDPGKLPRRGFHLVPSVFSLPDHVKWQINPDWQPMLIYSARGSGLWHTEDQPQPDAALELTLGASKARILQSLLEPVSSGQLAEMLHVTPGSVSQQLGKLSEAGLVASHRDGSRVYYRLSRRGEGLLDLFIG